MLVKRNYLTAGAAFFVAFATGYVMQNGDALAARFLGTEEEAPPIEKIELAAATMQPAVAPQPAPQAAQSGLPRPPAAVLKPKPLTPDVNGLAARVSATENGYSTPETVGGQQFSKFGLPCEVSLVAQANSAAMVDLDLSATCREQEAVTVRHGELLITETTSNIGRLHLSVPALHENAEFEVTFEDGKKIRASALVPDLSDYDRVAVQWSGDPALGIHALEFGAAYGGSGHVSIAAPRNAEYSEQARGGFLTSLGGSDGQRANRAMVYSFPSGLMSTGGVVRLSVEAEVTAYNCDNQIEAQALETGPDGVSVVDLTLSMPACDAVGELLVLKNLLRDLKVAQN